MFRKLFSLWEDKDLLRQAFRDTAEMLRHATELFDMASAPLFSADRTDSDAIYAADRKINYFEIEVRRKVLEHLSISPEQDTTAALVLTTITVDIERLGDYSKNFFELHEQTGFGLMDSPIFAVLSETYLSVKSMFEKTLAAFEGADSELAREVMAAHLLNSERCESVITEMLSPEVLHGPACDLRVMSALAARYLKRISAHLKNIASSVINPFDRIGFKPPDGSGRLEEFDD